MISHRPTNPDAHNNLGFCLIPVHPHDALSSLEKARSLGYEPEIVNVANRARCLWQMGRNSVAAAALEDAVSLLEDGPVFAWLWSIDLDTDPVVEEVADVRSYISKLGAAIAAADDDQPGVVRWNARRAALSDESPEPA